MNAYYCVHVANLFVHALYGFRSEASHFLPLLGFVMGLLLVSREWGNEALYMTPLKGTYIYICERDLLGPFHVYHLYEEFNLFTY